MISNRPFRSSIRYSVTFVLAMISMLGGCTKTGPINGVARIVQDNLQSTYNACFEENGERACSYQP
jgi:hypothetical protein